MDKRYEFLAQLSAILILVIGCFLVLKPFIAATLLAAAVCVSTWPLYLWCLRKLGGRKNIAALTMTFSLVVVIILPLALVASNLADNITAVYNALKAAVDAGPIEPPGWLKELPFVGKSIDESWRIVANSQEEMLKLAKRLLEPARNFLLAGGLLLGRGVLEMSLAAFVSFFFYRDGTVLIRFLNALMTGVVGLDAAKVLATIKNTVRGVMYGLLGTSLAQGFVAAIGFLIAGLPAVLLLGAATALLSLLPIGPPLIWGGAAIWLFYQGQMGWGIFMLLWGFFLISSVDNVLKPMLISHGSNLPFALVLFGVMGGVLAFGFVGVFIGPTLLAIAYNLLKDWPAHESVE